MTQKEFNNLKIGDKVYTRIYTHYNQEVEVVLKRTFNCDVQANDGKIIYSLDQWNLKFTPYKK